MTKQIGKKIFETLTKISPKLSTWILYVYRTKKVPNLKKPKNFNEKMSKLKLSYSHNALISKCTDKYDVREYVKQRGLESILNELYFVFNSVEEINFNDLPNRFALKCTHGCAYNIICKDKKNLDIPQAKYKLNQYMNEKYGLATRRITLFKYKA